MNLKIVMSQAVGISVIVGLVIGIFPSQVFSQTILNLPVPGQMVFQSKPFAPTLVKGIKIDPNHPLQIDFIVDAGDDSQRLPITSVQFKEESERLVKYFLAALAVPEKDLWVNLSPYEKNRIIPEALSKTELGQNMLAQDYVLKQLTASLIYPEKELGKAFWSKIYERAKNEYDTTTIPVNAFNKVWIVADKARVLERNNAAYVVGAHLKVMLERDYEATQRNNISRPGDIALAVSPSRLPREQRVENESTPGKQLIDNTTNQVIRDLIIPEIEKEVNQGENFAELRKMYYAMILATWYKMALKNTILNKVYSDRSKIGGIQNQDPNIKEKIYRQYLEAYRKGVFNYIKEESFIANDHVSLRGSRQRLQTRQFFKEQQGTERKYFSGGLSVNIPQVLEAIKTPSENDVLSASGKLASVKVDLAMIGPESHTARLLKVVDARTPSKRGLAQIYERVPQERKVNFEVLTIEQQLQMEASIKEVISKLRIMLDVPGNMAPLPTDDEIFDAIVDTSLFHPYSIKHNIAPTFLLNGSIFNTYAGEKKPSYLAVTLGKDFMAVTGTYADLPSYKQFTKWKQYEFLSENFDLKKFTVAKGGLRVYSLGGEGGLKGAVEDKWRGVGSKHLLTEVADLARGMGDKSPPADVFFEGGKTVLIVSAGVDPKAAVREWTTSSILAGVLGRLYIAGPDMNSANLMGIAQGQANRIHKALGMPLIPVTTSIQGNPTSIDHYKWTVTSISAFESFMVLFNDPWVRERYKIMPNIDLVIQGYGDVGSGLVFYINERYKELIDNSTIRIVAVSDKNGGIYAPDGLDINDLLELRQQKSQSVKEDYKKDAYRFDDGTDVFFVRSAFDIKFNYMRSLVAFPAAGPNVFTSPDDIYKLKRSGVSAVIAPGNNVIKEDSGLEQMLEAIGVLFVGASSVSFGGIYASTQEVFQIMRYGLMPLYQQSKSDDSERRQKIQDGIRHLSSVLMHWELNEFKKAVQHGKEITFHEVHAKLASEIRKQKDHFLKEPSEGFIESIKEELGEAFKEQGHDRDLNISQKDAIALVVILQRVIEHARNRVIAEQHVHGLPTNAAMAVNGGIDLNAQHLDLSVERKDQINVIADKAIIAQFEQKNFLGVTPTIVSIMAIPGRMLFVE